MSIATGAGTDTSSTFAQNTRLPVHRWFRFSAGFSAAWAGSVIRDAAAPAVLDPFAGCGTTLLAAEDAGVEAIGVEAHPFLHRVARAKLCRGSSPEEFLDLAQQIRHAASKRRGSSAEYPALVQRCFPPEVLEGLDALRIAVEDRAEDAPAWHLCWLALVGILRACSPVGTAQWQYVLPRKTKKRPLEPFAAFDGMVAMISQDMRTTRPPRAPARVVLGDARDLAGVPDNWASLVVTSPPYPNNYDYADATRLEMCFLREIQAWGDLQGAVRRFLVRACSQHVPQRTIDMGEVLAAPHLAPIRAPLTRVCEELAAVRTTRGGRKTYHLMVTCYFSDLGRVWLALRRACGPGARACFVVGDSAPYGVHVPVIDWLGELALAAGFRSWRFEHTRERNVKWRNRKHRVPLCEGRLWVDG